MLTAVSGAVKPFAMAGEALQSSRLPRVEFANAYVNTFRYM
jgi:hypothetical protein